jgi:hypothetical protein
LSQTPASWAWAGAPEKETAISAQDKRKKREEPATLLQIALFVKTMC